MEMKADAKAEAEVLTVVQQYSEDYGKRDVDGMT